MANSKLNPKVDRYLSRAGKWEEELRELREIVLECQLTEDLKWRAPCYMFQKSNILILGGLKEYCVLSFFKGALLEDPKGILEPPGKNTQSARLIRFTSVQEIIKIAPILKVYIHEAIAVERAGLKVDFKEKRELVFPEEFQQRLDNNRALKVAFTNLTPGRQRAYNLYFSAAKQSKTRVSRIEKCIRKILDGKGLTDE